MLANGTLAKWLEGETTSHRLTSYFTKHERKKQQQQNTACYEELDKLLN